MVGFGNSGAEIALDLWEHGAAAVTVAVRSPINLMPRWFMEVYPHGHGLLRLLERFCTPPWLSDALATYVFYPLLYPDLGSLGLRLSTKGIKTSLVQDHSPPLLDIGAIELIRKRQVHVQQGQLCSLGADGSATFCDTSDSSKCSSPLKYDLVVLATGYTKARDAAPHAQFLPKASLPLLLSAHGQIESGARPKLPGLWFAGFTDHVGRLLEISWEAPLIADATLAASLGARPWPASPPTSYEHAHRARFTPRVCTQVAHAL